MLTREIVDQYRKQAVETLRNARIVVTEAEEKQIEIADFGLGQFEQTGSIHGYKRGQGVVARKPHLR